MMDANKILVVVAVLSTVLIGLGAYLFWLDRRIASLEKRIKQSSHDKSQI